MGGTLQASAIKHESASTANLTLASDGKATFGGLIDTGATGQIKFPATANPSADANTLDDYEEGTFTATLGGGTDQPTTPITTTGYYTKIGNIVKVTVYFVNKDSSGASGYVRITGLPFAATLSENYGWGYCNKISKTTPYILYVSSGSTMGVFITLDGMGAVWTGVGTGTYSGATFIYSC